MRHGAGGLGLAIVKKIVEAHGSPLEVESIKGRGTEFSFLLKVQAGELKITAPQSGEKPQ
jgi:signal transduction histidine kinase